MKPRAQRTIASVEQRCHLLEQAVARITAGESISGVWHDIARQSGSSIRTVQRWYALVQGQPRCEWPECLQPGYVPRQPTQILAAAWETFLTTYLATQPASIPEAYAATAEAAQTRGWTIPGMATFRRRLNQSGQARQRYRERYLSEPSDPA